MYEDIEKIVSDLKLDKRFSILKDNERVGYWASCGANYSEYTELESEKLKILYVKEMGFGSKYSEEITVINKKHNKYVFCNSVFKERAFKDHPIIKSKFKLKELIDYISENA